MPQTAITVPTSHRRGHQFRIFGLGLEVRHEEEDQGTGSDSKDPDAAVATQVIVPM